MALEQYAQQELSAPEATQTFALSEQVFDTWKQEAATPVERQINEPTQITFTDLWAGENKPTTIEIARQNEQSREGTPEVDARLSATKIEYPESPVRAQTISIGDQTFQSASPEFNQDTPERRAFIEAQNNITDQAIDPSTREVLANRLNQLMDYEWRSGEKFVTEDGSSYVMFNNGRQDQDVVVRREPDGTERVVLDPNTFGENTYLADISPSPDGRYLAYSTTEGSDWTTWRIRDLQTNQDLPDTIEWTKGGALTWADDGQGFYYTRLPEPAPGSETTAANENWTMNYHRLGSDTSADRVIADPENPSTIVSGGETDDGRYLIVYTSNGTGESNGLEIRDLQNPEAPPVVIANTDNGSPYSVIDNDDSTFYLQTTDGASNGRVIAVDINDPSKVTEVISEPSNFAIQEVLRSGDQFVVSGIRDGSSVLNLYDSSGQLRSNVELPGAGRVADLTMQEGSNEVRFAFSSLTQPNTLMRLDTSTGELTTSFAPEVNYDTSDYVTELVYFPSGDGTEVPMYIARRRDLPMDGDNPTDLRVYGGFNANPANQFSSANILFLEQGGVIAVPVLRGDGGRGDDWHDAGSGQSKENTFVDAEYAARYLQQRGYSSPETTGITGASNGGLTVAAVLNRSPELFGAGVAEVPLISMSNFNDTAINPGGSAWVEEFGDPANADVARLIRRYDPLSNLRDDGDYPPTLIVGDTQDDRVGPTNALTLATELQAVSDNPVYLYMRGDQGHGLGNQESVVTNTARRQAFLLQQLRRP